MQDYLPARGVGAHPAPADFGASGCVSECPADNTVSIFIFVNRLPVRAAPCDAFAALFRPVEDLDARL